MLQLHGSVLIWHYHVPVLLPTNAVVACPSSSLTNSPPRRGSKYPYRATSLLPLSPRFVCSQIIRPVPAPDSSSSSPWGLTWLPTVCACRVFCSSPHLPQSLHTSLMSSSHHVQCYSSGQGRAGKAAACTFRTCRPTQPTGLPKEEGTTREAAALADGGKRGRQEKP